MLLIKSNKSILFVQAFNLQEGLDIVCHQNAEVVAFGRLHSVDPTTICHFQHCGDKRCVIIITSVLYPKLQLRYPHGEFETLGDLLQIEDSFHHSEHREDSFHH